MSKFKKIILTVVCIVSVFVVASVPCFATTDDVFTISMSDWSKGSGRALLSEPTVIRLYSMGAETNRNSYCYTTDNRFILGDVSYPSSPSVGVGALLSDLRLGIVLTFNDLYGSQPLSGSTPPIWYRSPNTYYQHTDGAVCIEFDLYVNSSNTSYYPELSGDITMNGFRSVYTSQPYSDKPPMFGDMNATYSYVSDFIPFYDSTLYGSSIEYVKKGSNTSIGQIYHCSFVAPIRALTTSYDFSLKIPMLSNHLTAGTTVNFIVTNYSCVRYDRPNDVPGFLYIPDFDGNFDNIESTQDYFNDNLSDSLDTFKDIGIEMTEYLKGDFLTAFAVWNQYLGQIFDIKPIRILLTFSIIIGIFTFVVGASNLVIGIVHSGSKAASKSIKSKKE